LTLVAVSVSTVASQIPGDPDPQVLSSCLTDSLEVRLESRLEDGPRQLLGGFEPIARRSDGRLFVRFFEGPAVVRWFDPSTGASGDIGREGQGPGEYLWPAAILIDETERATRIIDSRQRRLVSFDWDGEWLGQSTLPVAPFIRGVWPLAGGHLLVNGRTSTPDWVGHNILQVHEGEVVATFDTSHGLFRADWAAAGQRRALVLSDDPAALDFLVGHRREYRIDRFRQSGGPVETFVREADWFRPWTRYGLPDPDWVPPPFLVDLVEVEGGLIAAVVNRPRANWREGVEFSDDGSKRIADHARTYEAIIEVIDLENSCVRAEGRAPLHIDATLRDGTLAGLRLDDIGRPSLEFWSIRLLPRGG
jgi:hypothetical protein